LPGKRRYLMELADALLIDYLAPLRIGRVRLTEKLQQSAFDEMADWGLESGDALHMAVARLGATQSNGQAHVLTLDKDFTRVDGVHIWGHRS
jgi:predicted nucleic acid-binding protein